ncbi:hypothetical protein ACVXHB_03175 [Escherichia coli]
MLGILHGKRKSGFQGHALSTANHRKEVDPAGVRFGWRAAMRAIRSASSGAIRVSDKFSKVARLLHQRVNQRAAFGVLFITPSTQL